MVVASPPVDLSPAPDIRTGLLTRRTLRTFHQRPVPFALRESILEAARWAPAAGDAQPVRFIVLDDPALKRSLQKLTRESKDISNHWEELFKPRGLRGYVQTWLSTPFCVAICANPGLGPRHIHNAWNHQIAMGAAAESLALAARYHGMALVMYTHFSQEKLKQLLDIPFEWDAMGVMGLGYPDLRRINTRVLEMSLTRLPLSDLVSSAYYGAPADADVLEEHEVRLPLPDLEATMRGLRRTTRFADTPIPAGALFEILRAARWAPSAGNFQPIRYVVLRDREQLARLQGLAEESVRISAHWVPQYQEGRGEHPDWTRVPVAIALIADPTKGGPHIHGEATHILAGGMAAQNMWLMAQGLGLGTTLVAHWIEEKVKVLINCPRTWDLAGVMPFGFPVETRAWSRDPLESLVYRDKFGVSWGRNSRPTDMSASSRLGGEGER
jgi:nitroreductase